MSCSVGDPDPLSYKRNIRIDRLKLEAFLSQRGSDMEVFNGRYVENVAGHTLRDCES